MPRDKTFPHGWFEFTYDENLRVGTGTAWSWDVTGVRHQLWTTLYNILSLPFAIMEAVESPAFLLRREKFLAIVCSVHLLIICKTLHFLCSQQLEYSKLLFQHHIKTEEALKFIQTPNSCWKKTPGLCRQGMNCLKDPPRNKYQISGPWFTSWNVLSWSRSTPARNTRHCVNFI